MAISRLRFIQQKKTAISKQQRRVIADLLLQGKEESAQIKVENIIAEDNYTELFEYLELYCELLLARIGLLGAEHTTCDPGLEEAVKVIIYAAFKTGEVKEVKDLKDLFIMKFGKEFAQDALNNVNDIIPQKVVKRCSLQPPGEMLVNLYLSEIAKAYSVPYSKLVVSDEEEEEEEESEEEAELVLDQSAIEVQESADLIDEEDDTSMPEFERRMSSSKTETDNEKPIKVIPPKKTLEDLHPEVKVPDGINVSKKKPKLPKYVKKSIDDDFDELKKRFDSLKRL